MGIRSFIPLNRGSILAGKSPLEAKKHAHHL